MLSLRFAEMYSPMQSCIHVKPKDTQLSSKNTNQLPEPDYSYCVAVIWHNDINIYAM